jgi:hypothetical protein
MLFKKKGFNFGLSNISFTIACDLLVMDLECRFLDHELMNVLGVIYPQHWLKPNCESTFVSHLSLIKRHYFTLKNLNTLGSWISKVISRDILNMQTSLFKLTILTQALKAMEKPINENLITKL